MSLTKALACARQLGAGGAGAALGMRRTLAAIMGSRLGSKALLAGATPRVSDLSPMYDEPISCLPMEANIAAYMLPPQTGLLGALHAPVP